MLCWWVMEKEGESIFFVKLFDSITQSGDAFANSLLHDQRVTLSG